MEDIRNIPHIPVTFTSVNISLGKGDSWPTWVIGELPRDGDCVLSKNGRLGKVVNRFFLHNGGIQVSLE